MLALLAKGQGLDPKEFLSMRVPSPSGGRDYQGDFTGRSRAIRLRGDKEELVLVAQEGSSGDIPGSVFVQLVLLSAQGQVLDRLQCLAASSSVRELKCETPTQGADDCAQAVIRFDRRNENSDNWYHGAHSIWFRKTEFRFWELERSGNGTEANFWRRNGLCRVKAFNGKLFVLSPRIADPRTRLAEARAVRIDYQVGGTQKSVTIEDRGRIAALVSKMPVYATINCLVQNIPQVRTMQFFMPDGTIAGLGFVSPTELYGGDWARIELRSSDFYARLCGLASEAEGKKITLPTLEQRSRDER